MYLKEKKHILKDYDIKFEQNSAFVTLHTQYIGSNQNDDGMIYAYIDLPKEIDTLYVQGEIFWQKDRTIRNITKKLYNEKREKASDLNESGKNICDIIGMSDEFEITNYNYNDKNKEIIIDIKDDVISEKLFQGTFKAYASVILACADDLEIVSCNYMLNGTQEKYTVSCSDTTGMVGKDIKKCGQEYIGLQELLLNVCCMNYFDNMCNYEKSCVTKEQFLNYAYEAKDNQSLSEYIQNSIKNETSNSDYIFTNNDFIEFNIDYNIKEKKLVIKTLTKTYSEEVLLNALRSYAYYNFAMVKDLETVEFRYNIEVYMDQWKKSWYSNNIRRHKCKLYI